MPVQVTINGNAKTIFADPAENLQSVLKREGFRTVRNSDDRGGFAGSDTILVDGKSAYASLMVLGQVEGREITTAESLLKNRRLSIVQQALVDAGTVQSGYNIPAAALLLEELFTRTDNPARQEIKDALSGLFIRDIGYMQFFTAAELAAQRLKDPSYTTETAPEFRDDLRQVGKVREKVDARKLVTGMKAYVEDMVDSDACHMRMLRSPHAHAYITSIDISEAEALPGVVTVITCMNCPDIYYGQAGQGFPEPSPYDRRMFNRKLRHVGDRVAAVAAETGEIAEEALKKIFVEYEVLPPVMSIEDAQAEGAPIIHNSVVSYESGAPEDLDEYNRNADPRDGRVIYQFPIGADPHKNIAASVSGGIGDIEKGFSQADVVLERTYQSSQVQCTPLETHAVYTRMEDDRLVIHASTQVPWHLRRIVAAVLGISENKVRVIKERVGGGYGSKQDILLEDVAAYATYTTGRPVFYRFTREDEFTANSTRHVMKIRVKLGAKKDGSVTAMYMGVEASTGPFGNHCLTVPMNACSKSLPLIICDHVKFDVTTYYGNIPPTGAYQGYGAPKGSFALMTAMAELSEALGMDFLELIEKNRVRKGTMLEILKCLGEGREGSAVLVESCGLDEALSEGIKMISWGEQVESEDPDVKIGKGFAIIQQGSGLPGLDHSCADIRMLADGSFMLHSGGADLGTGLDTVSVKFAAEVLCVEMDRVSILSGDTDNTPFDTGAYASSGTYFSGSASMLAAQDLRKKILEAASHILGEPAEDLEACYPGAVRGKKGACSYLDIARAAQSGTGVGELMGYASFTTENFSFPYGAHFCQVAVNCKTGEITIQKYYALQDCGTPVNPDLALGQVYGGVLKTIGHSLYEEMKFDEQGACVNANLKDYGVPMIGDLPEDFQVRLMYTDDPYGPYGAKSISEVSCNGAAPALASAIHDATGVWIRDWPFTPEKILRGLGKIY